MDHSERDPPPSRGLGLAVEGAGREQSERGAATAATPSSTPLETLSTALILDSLEVGVHTLDTSGRVVSENRSAVAMFGWAERELVGRSGHALIHHHRADGSAYPEEECPILRTLRDGLARKVGEEVFFRKDGTSFPVEYTCSPVRADAGEVVGAVVTFRDVTAERGARQALRDQQTWLAEAQRIASMGNWELDVASGRLTWSPEMYRLVGVEPERFDGTFAAFLAHILPEDRPRMQRAYVETGPDGNLTTEYRIRRPDGGIRWLAARGQAQRDAAGRLVRVLGITQDVTRQKETDLALRASEERFRRVFQDAAAGIAVIGADGRLRAANAAYCRSLGRSEEALRGSEHLALVHPEDRAEVSAQVEALSAGHTSSCTFEKRYLGHAGETVWLEVSISAQRSASGTLESLVAVASDVTERKRVGAALERSQALLRVASRVGHLGGWSVDLRTGEMHWSEEVCAIHQLEPKGPLRPEDGVACYVPEHRETIRAAFEACAQHGRSYDLELEIITAKGRRIWVRTSGEALRDGAGNIVAVQGAFQDISARKQTELALVVSERRYHELADAMPFIVWTAGADGGVDYANRHFVAYSGMREDELVGTAWVRVLHPEDRERTLASWAAAVQQGQPYSIEFRICRLRDGAYRWHLVRGCPIRNEFGAIVKWYGTAIDIHESKDAERAAQVQAAEITATLESITDVFFTVDHALRLAYVNGEAQRLLQRPASEARGIRVAEAFPDSFGAWVERTLAGALERRQPVEFEAFHPSSQAWYAGRAYPSEVGLVVYLRDVTEVRRSREALQASDERFKLLSHATRDGIWDWDLLSDQLWCNDVCEALLGHHPPSARRTLVLWRKRLHPDDAARVLAAIRKALREGASHWQLEHRLQKPDGSFAYLLTWGFILRDGQGKAIRMVGGKTDLTARIQAEERLAEQAALLDASRDPIVVRDLDDHVVYWSKGAERTYGWEAPLVLGRKISEVFPGTDQLMERAHEEVLETGEWAGEMLRRTRDGRLLHVDMRWTLLRDGQGKPKGILAIHADVTERKQLEQQVLRNQRIESIGTMAGGIAHDLNNLLAPILATASVLMTEVSDPTLLEDLQVMQQCAQRGANLIRQLLTFARGASGQRIEVRLSQVVGELEHIVRDTFPKNLDIGFSVRPDVWEVVGDPTQLYQVLLNLCVNARDAMPQGGTLRVTVENVQLDEVYAGMHPRAKGGPYVALRVTDSGCGMSPEVLDRMFEPFFTTKEVGKGTGLGLSTTHAIVKSHGGFIDVSSEVGRGTRFAVYLPANPAPVSGRDPSEAQAGLLRGRGELILVVDDEPHLRALLDRILSRYGYRTIVASNGAEAVSVYVQQREAIAAVITDMAMPVMDGRALIAALTAINPAVRIIGSSGLEAQSDHPAVVQFLAKPYTAQQVLGVLREVLNPTIKS